ncbi:organic cation transporter protein-like [Littorina saxatilis]|uniref:organic cation transporter protein-like n=1 Tax=Littorina saxatilis TaxID=31220 RepID=UPI0038B4794F
MKFDDILEEIGEFGWYQRRVYLLAAAPSILIAFETLGVIFIFFIPDHRCAIPGYSGDSFFPQNDSHSLLINQTIPFTNGKLDRCHVLSNGGPDVLLNVSTNGNASYAFNASYSQSKCESWVYDHSVFESTIATDFDVVCDRSVLRASSNMISEVGTLFGTFFIGLIADRFGRKIPFYLGGLALVGGGFGIAFTQNLITLNICRFVLGLARMALFINGIVIGMEMVGPSKRAWAGILIEFAWCLGEFLLLPFVYFIRNWRYLEIAVSVPSIVLLAYWWVIPESPRWLASRGREEEAMKILERIAKSNKTVMPNVDDSKDLLDTKDHLSFRHALKSKELIVRVVIVLSNMFVIVVVYYGLTLNITNLSGDLFSNFAIGAATETLAYVVTLVLLDRLGRKLLFTGSMLLAGAACTLSILPVVLGAPDWIVVALGMTGRFAVCIAFATIYVYGAELFPTVVRSSAMAVGVTFSRFGSILSPYLADVGLLVGGRFRDALPLVVMGSPALVVGLFSLWLPETLHTRLPETIEDLEHSKINRGFLCCKKQEEDGVEITVTPEENANEI